MQGQHTGLAVLAGDRQRRGRPVEDGDVQTDRLSGADAGGGHQGYQRVVGGRPDPRAQPVRRAEQRRDLAVGVDVGRDPGPPARQQPGRRHLHGRVQHVCPPGEAPQR